jgi:hypothetical protein
MADNIVASLKKPLTLVIRVLVFRSREPLSPG